MTKKELKQVEKIIEKLLHDIIYNNDFLTLHRDNETMFSLAILEEMEAYLGHSIDFMGIS